MSSLVPNDVTTALIVPIPSLVAREVNAIREKHDKAFQRWMPHINIMFPFVAPGHLSTAAMLVQRALVDIDPFPLRFDKVSYFVHRDCFVAWLAPTAATKAALQRVYAQCIQQFARTPNIKPPSEFEPHCTLGQFPLPPDSDPEAIQQRCDSLLMLLSGVTEVRSTLCNVETIHREGKDEPFKVRHCVPLKEPIPAAPKTTDSSKRVGSSIIPRAQRAAHAEANVVAWLRRMDAAKLPKTIGAFKNTIESFCRIKVDAPPAQFMTQLKNQNYITTETQTKTVAGASVETPARGGRGGRGGARGGRGGTVKRKAPAQRVIVNTVRLTPKSLALAKTATLPEPYTSIDRTSINARIDWFLACLAKRLKKGTISEEAFLSQAKFTLCMTDRVSVDVVSDALVANGTIHVDDEGAITYSL